MRLAQSHPEWALGFEDECWYSRIARPSMHAWSDSEQPLHLVEKAVPKDDPDPKALACYGMLVRWFADQPHEQPLLRFADGNPVSALTIAFFEWSCERLEALGKKALLLVWDNAPWHVSARVRTWISQHNQKVKQDRRGVRIVVCNLPVKSPWLNPIEPKWIHTKRRVVEADGLLGAQELAQRVYDSFGSMKTI